MQTYFQYDCLVSKDDETFVNEKTSKVMRSKNTFGTKLGLRRIISTPPVAQQIRNFRERVYYNISTDETREPLYTW